MIPKKLMHKKIMYTFAADFSLFIWAKEINKEEAYGKF